LFLISPKISPILYSMVFGPLARCLKPCQVGEQLAVDEIAQVVAGHGLVVVELAVGRLGRGPAFPAVGGFVQDEAVLLAFQRGLGGLVCSSASRYFRNSSQDDCSV
jgi:hypothetical protein